MVSMTPCSQLHDANCMRDIDTVEQSTSPIHGSSHVVCGKPRDLDCVDVEMGFTRTVIVEMQGSHSTQSLTSTVNMPFDGNDELKLSQDDSNEGPQRERSIADLERDGQISDMGADNRDIENDLPLSRKQNQPNQAMSVVQESFSPCASFGDRVCRVCYMGPTANCENGPAIELGCECKLDLAIAHQQCAETWFKIKGNRTCEICGTIVHNVNGIGDATFIGNCNDGDARSNEASRMARFWQSHRLFNVLLAIMVLAFVLPWLFHVGFFIT
eukprot:c14233_g1_i1 orf=381-1193(+)